jgi:hypothetical protein
MIELIEDLISKNHAYEKNGHVLFHVLHMRIMESFLKEIVMNKLPEVGLKLLHLRKIQLTLSYGSQVITSNLGGIHHGVMEGQVGIPNVLQCLKKH